MTTPGASIVVLVAKGDSATIAFIDQFHRLGQPQRNKMARLLHMSESIDRDPKVETGGRNPHVKRSRGPLSEMRERGVGGTPRIYLRIIGGVAVLGTCEFKHRNQADEQLLRAAKALTDFPDLRDRSRLAPARLCCDTNGDWELKVIAWDDVDLDSIRHHVTQAVRPGDIPEVQPPAPRVRKQVRRALGGPTAPHVARQHFVPVLTRNSLPDPQLLPDTSKQNGPSREEVWNAFLQSNKMLAAWDEGVTVIRQYEKGRKSLSDARTRVELARPKSAGSLGSRKQIESQVALIGAAVAEEMTAKHQLQDSWPYYYNTMVPLAQKVLALRLPAFQLAGLDRRILGTGRPSDVRLQTAHQVLRLFEMHMLLAEPNATTLAPAHTNGGVHRHAIQILQELSELTGKPCAAEVGAAL